MQKERLVNWNKTGGGAEILQALEVIKSEQVMKCFSKCLQFLKQQFPYFDYQKINEYLFSIFVNNSI